MDTSKLIRESLHAVREANDRMHRYNGWQALQERDDDGLPKGPLPYSDAAIDHFLKARDCDPDSPNVAHHLAVCLHARAWDLELKGDPDADRQWERALGAWRKVVASPELWRRFKEKLVACDADADIRELDSARNHLYEHLLEVHVDFIRHYFEIQVPDRAAAHVGLVRRAKIPPAVRKRMVGKLFEAMTVNVPMLRSAGKTREALEPVERYLKLYDGYLPALQMHAEICRDLLEGLSIMEDWDGILSVAARAEPCAVRLAGHEKMPSTPLAKTALEGLALEMMRKAMDRASIHASTLGKEGFSTVVFDSAEATYGFAIRWGELALPICSSGSGFKSLLASAYNGRAVLSFNYESRQIEESNMGMTDKLESFLYLTRKALSMLQQALRLDPADETLKKNLAAVETDLADLETKAHFYRSVIK